LCATGAAGRYRFRRPRTEIGLLAHTNGRIAQPRTSETPLLLGKQARLGHHHWAGSSFKSALAFTGAAQLMGFYRQPFVSINKYSQKYWSLLIQIKATSDIQIILNNFQL
jgi:hypothetical protein